MKRSVVSILFLCFIGLISVACGTAPVNDSDAPEISKVDQAKPEMEEISQVVEEAEKFQQTDETQKPQWVEDGGESASSPTERCVVGEASAMEVKDHSMATMQAFDKARIKFCKSTVSVDIDTATGTTVTKMSRCVIPATEKRDDWKSADGTVYVLVCANRNEIDDEYEDERMEETDEDSEQEN